VPLRPSVRAKLIATMDEAEIRGARVVLVPLRGDDADELAGLLDDATIRGFLGVAHLAGLRRRFAGWEARRVPHGGQSWLNWIVRAGEDGRALGWVQATVEDATASVAYTLLPAERGRGAASDALRTLTAWLRESLGVVEISASIAPENTASERVARAAGFVPTARWTDGHRVWRFDGGP
jgi:RimJ/RimL family protein N-acetyltransferase